MVAGNDQSKEYLRQLVRISENSPQAIGYEKLTVNGTSATLASIPTDANFALMIIESTISSVSVRYREDGGAPTATDGMSRSNTEAWEILSRQNINNFKVIETAAGTHTLHVTYYK
jgi:hypothetical protein